VLNDIMREVDTDKVWLNLIIFLKIQFFRNITVKWCSLEISN
jgi:hypothetical protein